VLCGAGGTVYFAALSQFFPRELAGRVNTAANMLVFGFAFLLQWLIGVVLAVLIGRGLTAGGAHVSIMSVLLCLEATALIWMVLGLRRRMLPARPG
jgi:hypothetical protein